MLVEDEAELVRSIYRMFMEGVSTNAIAKHLTDAGIPTPSKKVKWQRQTVESILTNEKYKGSALLQKKYTVDFLQKKMKVNEGEVPQYYVEHSHPAIIAPEEWERVQNEFNRRKNSDRRTLCNSPFAGKIFCGDCGEIFGSKVWHSNIRYRRTIWQCNAKFKGEHKCKTPHLYEDDIKDMFVLALSKLMQNREALLEDGRLIYTELSDTAEIDKKCDKLLDEIDVTKELIARLIKENAMQALNQEDYLKRYESLAQRHDKLKSRYEVLQQKRERRLYQADTLSAFLFALKELDILNLKWAPTLCHTTVDKVVANADESVFFHFKNGSEITV